MTKAMVETPTEVDAAEPAAAIPLRTAPEDHDPDLSEGHAREAPEVVPDLNKAQIDEVDSLAEALATSVAENATKRGILVTERNLTIYLRKINRNLITDAWEKIPDPAVPTWMDPDREREMENPNDPEYLKAVSQAQMKRGRLLGTVNIALGVRAVHGIEEAGMVGWDDPSWAETVTEYTDILIPPIGSKTRMVAWMRYYALSGQDLQDLSLAVATFSNCMLREADVEIAERSFRC